MKLNGLEMTAVIYIVIYCKFCKFISWIDDKLEISLWSFIIIEGNDGVPGLLISMLFLFLKSVPLTVTFFRKL